MSRHRAEQSLDEQEIRQLWKSCERLLLENIIPFWHPGVIDRHTGGYSLHHDAKGTWLGPCNKSLVAQARTLWFFSRLSGTGYGTAAHIEAARHGYRFLRECLWDREFGGFYWEVSRAGREATMPDKQLYGQAFALYALAEYSRLGDDNSALTLADELFRLLETRAHDGLHGGYRECLRRDWGRVPDAHAGYMNTPCTHKLMNTHLHMLEAITAYYQVRRTSPVHERLHELILILGNTVSRNNVAACVDEYQRDWEPLQEAGLGRISYGHQLEIIWLLMDACDAAGMPAGILLPLYRALFDYALQYGFDRSHGGFYHSGIINAAADRREKVWWVQAESLVCALRLYALTQEKPYLDCFRRILDWIVKHQADWECGDWHEIVTEDYSIAGHKAYHWKSPYHNGRAMLLCLELLSRMTARHNQEERRLPAG